MITAFLEPLDGATIHDFVFTGGEPLLKPELIRHTLNEFKRFDITVDRFCLITNGLMYSAKILSLLMDIYVSASGDDCDDKFYFAVSTDDFHKNEFNFKQWGTYEENSLRFEALNFYREHSIKSPLAEGRAETFGDKPLIEEQHTFGGRVTVDEDNEIRLEDELCYVNAKGKVVCGCNWSYKTQDRIAVCDASKLTEHFEELLAKEKEEERKANKAGLKTLTDQVV